jgi:UDP-N-acetyl-D-mannosaminuronate dehydrogenase
VRQGKQRAWGDSDREAGGILDTGGADPAVARVDATAAEIARADLVVLLTEHDAFSVNDVTRHARYVLDCRRVLSGRTSRRSETGASCR